MAAWLPIIKVALPYLGPVLQAALPAFTKKKSDRADPLVEQQIVELQEAVKTNSESTRALARAIEEIAQANDRAMKRAQRLIVLLMAMSLVALLGVVVLLFK